MTVLAAFPDAELVAMDLLAPLAVTVTQTNENLTPPVVQVQRVGGTDNGITDRPRVQVTYFGATRPQAWALAGRGRQLVQAAAGTAVSGAHVSGVFIDSTSTEAGGVQVPDPNRDIRKVIETYSLTYRRPR
jgi:hypothetical protein